MNQVNQIRFQIYQVDKDNYSANIGGANPPGALIKRLSQLQIS